MPKEVKQVALEILIIGALWLICLIVNWFLFARWMVENLALTLLCALLPLVLYKFWGIAFFLIATLVFSAFVIFGSFFFVSSFVTLASELLSNYADLDRNVIFMKAIYHTAGFLIVVFSARIIFYLLTSDGLNSYLGTEAIFPIRKRKPFKIEEVSEDKKRPPIERWS